MSNSLKPNPGSRSVAPQQGALIAFMGIPGCGKSTTAKALSALIPQSRLFPEPQDREWPPAVIGRHRFGYFTAITWFRSMRVPLLYMADETRSSGGITIVDSYYDKLIADYIEHPDMRWLMPPDDAYFSVLKQMAMLDRTLLPDADWVVFLRVHLDGWRQLLSTRHREMDAEDLFLKSFPTQDVFLSTAHSYAQRACAHLLVHDQQPGTPGATATALYERLKARGLIV